MGTGSGHKCRWPASTPPILLPVLTKAGQLSHRYQPSNTSQRIIKCTQIEIRKTCCIVALLGLPAWHPCSTSEIVTLSSGSSSRGAICEAQAILVENRGQPRCVESGGEVVSCVSHSVHEVCQSIQSRTRGCSECTQRVFETSTPQRERI
jgi:hypothetical protein